MTYSLVMNTSNPTPQVQETNGLDGSTHFSAASGVMGARRISRLFEMGEGVYAVTREYLSHGPAGLQLVSDPPVLCIEGCTAARQFAQDHCRGWK